MCDFPSATRSKAEAALAVSILCAMTCAAEFVPGRIYFAAGRTEPGPGNQPSNAVYEFDPVTRESRVFATIMERTVVLDGLSFTPDGSGLRAGLGYGGRVIEFDGDGAISTVYQGPADGIGYPLSTAFDGLGNFYVANYPEAVVRFPNDTSPPELVIGRPEIKETGDIAADSMGNLYLRPTRVFPSQPPTIVRVGLDGTRIFFPRSAAAIAVAGSDDLLIIGGGVLRRYAGGDPDAEELVASDLHPHIWGMAANPDGSEVFGFRNYGSPKGTLVDIYRASTDSGSVDIVATVPMPSGWAGGKYAAYYVPEPSSAWLLMISATFVCRCVVRRDAK